MQRPTKRRAHRLKAPREAVPTSSLGQRSRTSDDKMPRRFSTEQELVSAFWDLFSQVTSHSWTWLRELDSPAGIADIVAVSLSEGWQQQTSMARVPTRWLYPLKSLSLGQELDAKGFASYFGVSDSCAHSVLSAYVSAGYCVHKAEQRRWTKVKDPLPVVDRIVAVEAKLRDWRRALYQAVQYASYASEAWVVLDGASLQSAAVHVDEFEGRGIGLMGLTAKGHSEILATPAQSPPRNSGRFWQANAEIARRLFEERAVVPS